MSLPAVTLMSESFVVENPAAVVVNDADDASIVSFELDWTKLDCQLIAVNVSKTRSEVIRLILYS